MGEVLIEGNSLVSQENSPLQSLRLRRLIICGAQVMSRLHFVRRWGLLRWHLVAIAGPKERPVYLLFRLHFAEQLLECVPVHLPVKNPL